MTGQTRACGTPTADGFLFGALEVGPGTSTAQGPSLPTVKVSGWVTRGHQGDFSRL